MKKNNPLVSIIIPIYNSQEHLDICLKSVFNQTYTNIEIIAINDGSTDSSLDILNKYKNSKLKIYNNKNHGVAYTRNYGIKKATGDYLVFIDNDDIIDNDFVEYFINNIENNDVLIGGYVRETYDGNIIFKRNLKKTGPCSPYLNLASWGKMYKTNYIKDNNIIFFNNKIADDLYFCSKLYNNTKKIKIIEGTKYHWLFNKKSLSNTDSKKLNRTTDLIELLSKIDNDIIFNDNDIKDYFFLRTIIYYILFSSKKTDYNIVIDSYDKLFNFMKSINEKYFKNKYLKLFCKSGEEFKIKIIIKVFLLMQKIKLDRYFLKLYIRL